ncbi:hypothetical protein ACWC2T_04885 [Streptomyces sp. NPDC001393]
MAAGPADLRALPDVPAQRGRRPRPRRSGRGRPRAVWAAGGVRPGRAAADPLIQRLLLPRTLLCLGVLAFVVGLFTGDGLPEPVEQGFTDVLLMLGTGGHLVWLADVATPLRSIHCGQWKAAPTPRSEAERIAGPLRPR